MCNTAATSSFTHDAVCAARDGLIRCLDDHPSKFMIFLSKNGHLTDWTTLALSEIPPYTEAGEDGEDIDGDGDEEREEDMAEDSSADVEVFAALTELRHLRECCCLRQDNPLLTLNLQIRLRKMMTVLNFPKAMIPWFLMMTPLVRMSASILVSNCPCVAPSCFCNTPLFL
jgi:hypothetical protein